MFKIKDLPFSANLNAIISKETCDFHHGKHLAAYVANLNNLVQNTEFENSDLFDIITKSSGAIFNNAAQIYNHNFYFDCIAAKTEMSDDLQNAINSEFDDFKSEFLSSAGAIFGSGWCWLVLDNDKLKIISTQNAALPIINNQIPLLVVDVWEHAYYIDYKNARAAYLERFFENINWAFVSDNFTKAKKDGLKSVRDYINS